MSGRGYSDSDDAEAALREHAERRDREGAMTLPGREVEALRAGVGYGLEVLRGINTKAMRPDQRRHVLNACEALDRARTLLSRSLQTPPG